MLEHLSQSTQSILVQGIRWAAPKEICGFVLQDDHGFQEIRFGRNLSFCEYSFHLLPSDRERIQRYAERTGMSIVSFFHSHRFGLDLSDEDRSGFQRSGISWIVLVLSGNQLLYKIYTPSQDAF